MAVLVPMLHSPRELPGEERKKRSPAGAEQEEESEMGEGARQPRKPKGTGTFSTMKRCLSPLTFPSRRHPRAAVPSRADAGRGGPRAGVEGVAEAQGRRLGKASRAP